MDDNSQKAPPKQVSLIGRLFGKGSRNSGDQVQHELNEETMARGLINQLLSDRKAERRSRIMKASIYFLIFGLPALLYLGALAYINGVRWMPTQESIGVVRIEGEIGIGQTASAEQVIPAIKAAFESPKIKAVVLAIDSNGGSPVEAERITNAMATLKARHKKPVISVIGNSGMSAGYMIAMNADKVYAARYSLVGSIGAVMAAMDYHQALDRVGVTQRVYASGPLKAMLNPFLPTTAMAEQKAQALVDQMGAQFRADVAKFRPGLPKGFEYGTGESWGGQEAQRIGLVDEVGTIDDVIEKTWRLPAHDFGPGSGGYKGIHVNALVDTMVNAIASTLETRAQAAPGVTLR
jgi:protease-4